MSILRSILRLLRYPNVATFPAPMQRLSSPSRPLSFMASAGTSWWPPALARRVFPLTAAPNPPVRRVSRFPHGPRNMVMIRREKANESGKPYMQLPISSANVITISQGKKHPAIAQGLKNIETRGTAPKVIDQYEKSDKDDCGTTSVVIDGKRDTWGQIVNLTSCEEDRGSATEDHREEIVVNDDEEGYTKNNVLAKSRHHDCSIYRGMDTWWKKEYRIADRNETRLEAMSLSDPTNCIILDGSCMKHNPRPMLQIFSLELAKIHVDGGLVELYGYIAVRDELDPLLNYVVNFSRDDPIIVEQGSLIKMTGPKRGIEMMDLTLIEYDMRVKLGKQEKDDLQLIDGASIIGPEGEWDQPFPFCIPGDSGTIEITLSRLSDAVEATVEVLISEVQSSFNLSLGCLTSGLNEEIRLFDGAIAEPRGLKRSVVAVVSHSSIDLKFKVGALSSSSNQHCCSFKAKTHGHDTQEIKTGFALISVKVTWSTLP